MDFRNLIGSVLSGRSIFAQRAGKTFGGKRDLYEALGYTRIITPEDYRDRYLRNAVAARVVESKPQDTWRSGFDLIEEEDETKITPFEATWKALDERLSIAAMMGRLDILAGLGHYAVMLIGAEGEMSEPLESADDIAYLSIFSEEDAGIVELEQDRLNARFGKPLVYSLRRRPILNLKMDLLDSRVHHTRIIHAAEGLLDDLTFGTPRLQRIWNLLDDLEKITGGGAEAFWKRADQGMQLNLDPSMELDDDEKKALQEEVDKYIHGMTRVMRTRGLNVNTLGSDTADIGGPAGAIIDQISAGTGIPQRILMGSEQAKLASTQDRTNWDARIEARRSTYAEPQIVRPFVDRLIVLGVLPEPKQYEIRWSQIRTVDAGEQSDYASRLAEINVKMGEEVVTVDEIRTRALGWNPLVSPTAVRAASHTPVHRTADRFRRQAKKDIEKVFNAARRALKMVQLKKALKEKDERRVMELVSAAIEVTDEKLRPVLEKTLTEVLNASGKSAARSVPKTRVASMRAAVFNFDQTDPKATEWIRQRAADTITGVSDTTRQTIRDLVEEAFEEQFTVDELASRIAKVIGDPIRAEKIARTETMSASNQGQQEAWNQATEDGFLTGDEKKEWIVTEDDRLCPICEPLSGETVELNARFSEEGPPAHTNCRCTIGLTL